MRSACSFGSCYFSRLVIAKITNKPAQPVELGVSRECLMQIGAGLELAEQPK
jgi:hypothetical protein